MWQTSHHGAFAKHTIQNGVCQIDFFLTHCQPLQAARWNDTVQSQYSLLLQQRTIPRHCLRPMSSTDTFNEVQWAMSAEQTAGVSFSFLDNVVSRKPRTSCSTASDST